MLRRTTRTTLTVDPDLAEALEAYREQEGIRRGKRPSLIGAVYELVWARLKQLGYGGENDE